MKVVGRFLAFTRNFDICLSQSGTENASTFRVAHPSPHAFKLPFPMTAGDAAQGFIVQCAGSV